MLSFRVTITSRQNPLVARFREAARGGAGSLLLLDGAHLVADAFASRITLTTVAVTPAALERVERPAAIVALLDGLATGVEIVTVTVSSVVMDAMSPVRSPSPIVALAERPTPADARIWSGDLAIVAVDVQDPGNVGAIVRVAEAGGASGLVAATGTADPFGWKALRGSMGSALRLPIVSGVDAATFVADARRRGLRIVATVPRDGQAPADVSCQRAGRAADRRRGSRSRPVAGGGRRRTRHHSDGRACGVAERGGHRSAARVRGTATADF